MIPRPSAAAIRRVFAVAGEAAEHFITEKSMSTQSHAEHELAQLLIESLNLEGVAAADIDPEAPLFGGGLGLDSIDALELALAISKRYGFQLKSDSEDNRRAFATLRALAAHIQQHKAAA